MKILAATVLTLLVWASYSPGQVHEQTPAGTTLAHFGEVDYGVYKGSRPRTDADFRFLQSRHVKYVMDLQLIPFLERGEQKKAKRYGMVVIHARINASPVSPSEKHIESILAILKDKHYHPIYFHCALGRDRTALVATLYKMYFMGMSQQDGWRYLHESGYKDGWVRSGLTRYLKRHPTPPPAFYDFAITDGSAPTVPSNSAK